MSPKHSTTRGAGKPPKPPLWPDPWTCPYPHPVKGTSSPPTSGSTWRDPVFTPSCCSGGPSKAWPEVLVCPRQFLLTKEGQGPLLGTVGNHPLGNPQTKAGDQAPGEGPGAASGARTEHAKETAAKQPSGWAVQPLRGCGLRAHGWAGQHRVPPHTPPAPGRKAENQSKDREAPFLPQCPLAPSTGSLPPCTQETRRKGPIHGCRAGPEEGL